MRPYFSCSTVNSLHPIHHQGPYALPRTGGNSHHNLPWHLFFFFKKQFPPSASLTELGKYLSDLSTVFSSLQEDVLSDHTSSAILLYMASPACPEPPNEARPLLPSTAPGCHRDASTHREALGDPLPFQEWGGTGWESSTERKTSNPTANHHSHGDAMGGPAVLQRGGLGKPPQAPSLFFKREQHRHQGFCE